MEVIWGIFDDNQDPVTGGAAATSLKIRRGSDGYFYDWSDGLFKNTGWTTLSTTLAEMDATNLPGYYKKDVTESGWTDGWYQAFARYAGTPKRNGDIEFLLEGGKVIDVHVADNLDVAVSTRASATDYTAARAAKLDNLDATVSSRSTLTASDVWSYATRTLTSFGTLVSDIWANITRTLTSGTRDTEIDAIKAKTDNLPATPADETTVSQRPTLAQIEASTVLAKQAKLDFVEKWILNRLVENPSGTWKLYDDDDITVLKTWTVSGTTRNKAV